MPDMHDDPLAAGATPHEIIHNLNRGLYELRRYGSSEAILSGDTATEVMQVAEVSGVNVHFIGGRPVGDNDPITVARDVDLKHRGMNPPGAARVEPGEQFELDKLATDLAAAAVIDAAVIDAVDLAAEEGLSPEALNPGLPNLDTIHTDKLAQANDEWLAAYEANRKAMKEMDDKLQDGQSFSDLEEELRRYRISREAMDAAEAKLADLGEPWAQEVQEINDRLNVDYETRAKTIKPDDPPEAELVDKPEPKPSSGPSSEALEEPVAIEPTIPMPTEHITTGTDQAQELREEAQTRFENRIANGMTPQDAANFDLAQQAAIDRGSFHPIGSAMWNLDVQHHTQVNLRLMAQHQNTALNVQEAGRALEPVKGVEKKTKLGRVLKR